MTKKLRVFLIFIAIYFLIGLIFTFIQSFGFDNDLIELYRSFSISVLPFWIGWIVPYIFYINFMIGTMFGPIGILVCYIISVGIPIWLSCFIEKHLSYIIKKGKIIIPLIIILIVIIGISLSYYKKQDRINGINIRLSNCTVEGHKFVEVCAKEVKGVYNVTSEEYNKWEVKNEESLNNDTKKTLREIFNEK